MGRGSDKCPLKIPGRVLVSLLCWGSQEGLHSWVCGKAVCVYNNGTDLKLPLEFRNSKRPQSEAVDASRVKMKIIRSQAFSGAAH